ncbi:DUF4240 domain-containing protein [Sphingomonas sp. PB4P5]|uniref:DUF4240 domain-containing protein n=1 Tax=Parasphingomonas puruogangriensis TaxID=3096155 RepID=UPI002FC959C6
MKMAAVCVLVVLLIAGLAIVGRFSVAKAGSPKEPAVAVLVPSSGPLAEAEFWALVDHSARLEADTDAQLADLKLSLSRLTPDQIGQFEKIFDATMRRSYNWDLWEAAYVANGGASDDGFEYFRCWLISKGRKVFEQVLADPDRLADLLAPSEAGGDLEFEEFAYVARQAWAAKSGRDWNEMPVIADMIYEQQPTGRAFSEDGEELARRYPKLWKRFGGGGQ